MLIDVLAVIGGTFLVVVGLPVLGFLIFNTPTAIEWGLDAIGRTDLEVRFVLWQKHLTGNIDENTLDSAEIVAGWRDVKDEVQPTIDSYRQNL